VGYSNRRLILEIKFANGAAYRYLDVATQRGNRGKLIVVEVKRRHGVHWLSQSKRTSVLRFGMQMSGEFRDAASINAQMVSASSAK
jgi:hypothetical protein